MKKLVVILVTILFMTTAAFAADPYVKVKKSTMEQIQAKMIKLQDIELAKPEILVKKIKIAEDQTGRIFVKDSAEVEVVVGPLHYIGNVKLDADVARFPKKDTTPFISRFGLATVAQQEDKNAALKDNKMDKGAVYLTYRVLGYKKLSLEGLANFKRYGIGLGYKLTPNTKAILGTNYEYNETLIGKSRAFIGVGFGF